MTEKGGGKTIMNSSEFFKKFNSMFEPENKDFYNKVCDAYNKSSEFTRLITEAIKKLLENEVYEASTEYYRVDISRWKKIKCDAITLPDCDYMLNSNLWDFDVAVEHENDDKDWTYEITKLLTVNCPLRVVIGYVPAKYRNKDERYLSEVFNQIKCLNVFSRNDFTKEEFIIILGNSKCESLGEYFNYKAYRLLSEGFTQLIVEKE